MHIPNVAAFGALLLGTLVLASCTEAGLNTATPSGTSTPRPIGTSTPVGLPTATVGLGTPTGGGATTPIIGWTVVAGGSGTPGAASAIQMTAQDFSFTPAVIAAKVGQKVTVTVKNAGAVEHNFSITSLQVDQDINPGATQTVTFTPTQAGSLQFFCEYHKNNMVGTVNVTS